MAKDREILLAESARFRARAADLALQALIGPAEKAASLQQLARDHALRAETFKEAARLVDRKS